MDKRWAQGQETEINLIFSEKRSLDTMASPKKLMERSILTDIGESYVEESQAKGRGFASHSAATVPASERL